MALDDRPDESGGDATRPENPGAPRTDLETDPGGGRAGPASRNGAEGRARPGPAGADVMPTIDWPGPTRVDDGGSREGPPGPGKYRVIRPLGHGGQADVFLAFDPDLGRQVVIKRYRGDAERLRALLGEGRALARVRSPYVARCLDADHGEDGEVTLVLEHISGKNLKELYERQPPSPSEAARLVEQVAEGLAEAHASCCPHLDLKPANIVRGDDGRPRIIDFGLSAGAGGGPEGSIRGTPSCMAPEQARGEAERIGTRTDVFGLGAVLYFLLTGRPPFEGENRTAILEQARRCEFAPPRKRNPKVPRALEEVCLKAMAAAPEQRYASAEEFRRAVHRARHRTLHRVLRAVAGSLLMLTLGMLLYQALKPGPSAPLAADLAVEQFRYLDRTDQFLALGKLGDEAFDGRLDDDLRVHFHLSAPAYCYLLALNPNGTTQLCLPADAKERPGPATDLIFPPAEQDYFRLTPKDGAGMQAFVLIASRAPLPPFSSWEPAAGLPWSSVTCEGVWEFDGRTFHLRSATGRRAPERGDVRRRAVAPEPLLAVCRLLRDSPGVDLVRAISFPVLER